MAQDLRPVLGAVLASYALPLAGIHGVTHWARVLENGLRLSQVTGANLEVVGLFAVLHDSRRLTEGPDPGHGRRAADFAASLRGTSVTLADDEFQLLWEACAGHTDELTHSDLTIQTCWDSDRLDLARVGVDPEPAYLSTATAKAPETMRWAISRAKDRTIPAFVEESWNIDLQNAGRRPCRESTPVVPRLTP